MNRIIKHPQDTHYYKRLIRLTNRQLADIHKNLTGKSGFFRKHLFFYRNARFKKSILALLDQKARRIGEKAALDEMMAELKAIEADNGAWSGTGKDELDYIRVMVHGLRDISGEEETAEEPAEDKKTKPVYRLKINECS